MARVKHLLK